MKLPLLGEGRGHRIEFSNPQPNPLHRMTPVIRSDFFRHAPTDRSYTQASG
jgi:hypothetical protein